jgi:hypothetical protein
VRIAARDALHTGSATEKSVRRTPSRARRSMFGVRIAVLP